jgi:CheY-like chemotaxis protein
MLGTPQPADRNPADVLREIRDSFRRAGRGPITGRGYTLAGDDGRAPPAQGVEETLPDSHTPTVLLVEDDRATREAMKSWLAFEGFSVLAAADGREAARHLECLPEPIDVVVLDVELPDVSGVDLCQQVRRMYPAMPVLVCPAGAEPEEVARLVRLGATRYFRKPVDPDEILAAVEAAVP